MSIPAGGSTVRVPIALDAPEDSELAPGSLAWEVAWALKSDRNVEETQPGDGARTPHELAEHAAYAVGGVFIDVALRRDLADAALRRERGIESFKTTDVVPAVREGNANAADVPLSDASIHQARAARIRAEQDLADASDRYLRVNRHEFGPHVPFVPLPVGEKEAEVARGKNALTTIVRPADFAFSAFRIREAWNMHDSVVRQRAEAEAALKSLMDVERHYREQYRLGYRSAADVIHAIDAAFAAEAAAISARYAEQHASIRLYAAQGRLVEALGAARFVEMRADEQSLPPKQTVPMVRDGVGRDTL
ncbi:hypothetical protein [Azospirillum sp. TSO5]|uniref:hypothetical protein n=1 Tax=Azospirillum sp. TSO5 TaxID=716760 RepID=UPI0011B24984|nr:hypothetical protein [Azospirillum sp. TSO5]